MEKYRSQYPTLRQAKTKWSKPSIIAKQGEGPSHDWLTMLKKDAKAKLAASIHQSKMGSVTRQQKIVHEDKVAVFQFDTQLQNVRMKETGVKRKKRMKDPRPTDFRRSDLKGFRESVESKANSEWIEKHKLAKEDKIGKSTPSAEEIAKKHKLPLDQINAQIEKGIKVEKEHTNNEAEAHEIARDHLDEFPDYYDRLAAMEKAAKKEMKEGWNPDVEQIRLRIDSHKKVAEKMAQQHGEHSQEAAFHRAYVKHLTKELKDVHGLDEAKKTDKLGFKMMKNDPPLPPPKTPHPVPKGYERVKDRWGFNVLRKKKVDEMMSVGSGAIAGMPTRDPPEQTPVGGPILRRKKFAGKTVFVVKPDTFYKSYLGKRKYEHYEKFLEGCEGFEEIRDFGRKHWDEPIILEDETTGAMVYLKYGRK